jgi:hypothetical protein
MAEVVADDGDIDARLQKGDSTAVTKDVRCDATLPQSGRGR